MRTLTKRDMQNEDRVLRFAKEATLLDDRGRVEHDNDLFNKPGMLYSNGADMAAQREDPAIPDHIRANLEKAAEVAGPFEPRNSLQTWEETLYATIADGGTITAAAEAIMVPIFTLPANYLYPGRLLKWTTFGRLSSAVTTPGTFTFKTAYSATGLGAVLVAQTGAYAPNTTAVATTLPFMTEHYTICRSAGTSGTLFGWIFLPSISDANDTSTATLKANLDMMLGGSAGVGAPATVAVDTTVARALNPTYTPSLGTASMTTHVAFLEALT